MATQDSGFQAMVIVDGGEPRAIYHSTHLTFGPTFSADGAIAVVASSERSGTLDYHLLAFDVASGKQIGELWDGAGTSVQPGPFSPLAGDDRMLATSSRSGYDRPLLWHPRDGDRQDLALDTIPGTVTPWDWSLDGKRVLLNQLEQATYQLMLYDVNSGEIVKLVHPSGVLGSGQFTAEGEIHTVWQDATHPPCLIALDGNDGTLLRTVLQAGSVPAGRDRRQFRFTSENGDPIQGWLSVPNGCGPFPTILHTHGGPTSVRTDTFMPAEQAWLDHGFAFASINYHGSVTFGQDFKKSIWGNLGDLEVQDMAAAYHWLVDQDIALPDAVFLTGGSYGGYLTLQAIGRRPELWSGGMAAVAIADWKLMYEDQAETLRGYQRGLFGGTPDETPEATASGSPINYAEQIAAPILVIQGSNDTRCPARQMVSYQKKLEALGKPITVHWFDAGHGSRAQEQQIEHQELMMQFVYAVLEKSRAQD
jgi:dipeptidyl aminopeptidase/acylaminoacyl peptidase